MKWQLFWPIRSRHCMLCCSDSSCRIEVADPRFVLNNELWNKFLLGHVGISRKVLQKLVRSSVLVLAFSTPFWHALCSYAEMHMKCTWNANEIFVVQKSHCAYCVLSLATIRSKYYFNFILNRTKSDREFFDRPSYVQIKLVNKRNSEISNKSVDMYLRVFFRSIRKRLLVLYLMITGIFR